MAGLNFGGSILVRVFFTHENEFGVGENQRFALPTKPQFGVQLRLVKIAPEFMDDFRWTPEWREERDLRGAIALATHLRPHAQQGAIPIAVGDLIGDIEDDHVHAGVREHLGVLAQDALVVRQIVSEERLAPMMRRVQRSPQRAVRLLHGLRIRGENLRHIERPALNVLAEPEEIEDADRAIGPWRGNGGIRGNSSAQGVGGHPGVGVIVPVRLRGHRGRQE